MAQVDSLHDDTPTLHYQIESVGVVERPAPIIEQGNSYYKLSTQRLNQLPKYFGSVDAIRSLQLMPGIQTTGDIGSGIYVQGCEPSHNMFLVEGAPVYSPIHLLGFIPVVNGDHLKSISIEKGFISARDGGRLASVIRCDSQEALLEKTELSGDVNPLSAALSLALPTSSKSVLRISGRRSFADEIIAMLRKSGVNMGDDQMSYSYDMSDINATWYYAPTANDKITLNGYYGADELAINIGSILTKSTNGWSNSAISGEWQHTTEGGGEFLTTIYNSQYHDKIALEQASIVLSLSSSINDSGVKFGYKERVNDMLSWQAGLDYAHRIVTPQEPSVKWSADTAVADSRTPIVNDEVGLYAECNFTLGEKWSGVGGVRYSALMNQCGGGLEPRANLRYRASSDLELALSYTRQYQYINQALVSGTGMPSNYFIPTTDLSPAQRSDNLALDVSYKFPNRVWSLSSMLYYRNLENQYENRSQLISYIVEGQTFDSRYDIAKGVNYGSEFLLKCNMGRLKGWISYTLSWAQRQSATVNNGDWFYASNDRRHDLSAVATYVVNDKWSVASSFVLATGSPITVATGLYCVGNQFISRYSDRNAARMPTYHHLDLSASCKLNIPWFKSSELHLSVYNIYARCNGVFFFSGMSADESGKLKVFNKYNALFSILPSVGLTFKL